MSIRKLAICVGINDYPWAHNDLNGCVNDAKDWADLLKTDFDFKEGDINILTNAYATRSHILSALTYLITSAGPGDVVVFTYSGYGTWVPAKGEPDESDNLDEALYVYDGKLLDGDIRTIIREIDPEAHLTVICDCSHSGTINRERLNRQREILKEGHAYVNKPRFYPPALPLKRLKVNMPVRKRIFYPEPDMPEVLLTGCNAGEASYDVYINGRYNGAMTANAIRLIKDKPAQTYREFYQKLCRILPSVYYQQSPQLEGSDENKNRPLFT